MDDDSLSGGGLGALEERIARDLELIAWPETRWVKQRQGPEGRPVRNVIVVGAGQGGIAVAWQLKRERVDDVLVVDRAPPGERGPWTTYARMLTLRSPKATTGPDLDLPSLTFRSWFEAQFGAAAWRALGKIPKESWAAYLLWLQSVTGLTVEDGAEATALRPAADHVAVDLVTAAGRRTEHARSVVLATGIESPGRWWMPPFLDALPAAVRNHTGEPIDYGPLRGKVVAVLGAGASAFDNAGAALEAGAGEVHVFFRRQELQRVQPYKQISYTGFLRHLADLDDARRWRFMRHLLNLREAFPAETWERFRRHPNAHLHAGRDWTGAALAADGRVRIETVKGPFTADHVIAGTGFDIDFGACPALAPVADRVALWSDRHRPPPGEEDDRLARYPYLGSTFELLAKRPEDAPALARIRLFTFAATMSFGPSGSSINAMKFAVPRLVGGITRDLFREDADAHFADLLRYDTPEF